MSNANASLSLWAERAVGLLAIAIIVIACFWITLPLLGVLVWVVAIALLGRVVARREAAGAAVAQALGLLVLGSLVFVAAVVLIEFAVSGAWIGPWAPM